jgi:hypothetical protein
MACAVMLVATASAPRRQLKPKQVRQVLVTGGENTDFNVSLTAELYNLAKGRFAVANGNPNFGRFDGSATRLSDGRVLLVGGGPTNDPVAASAAELYDPSTQKFVNTGVGLATGRFSSDQFGSNSYIEVLLSNKKVLIAGGFNPCCGVLASAELYDPTANSFSTTGNMTAGRQGAMAAVLNNGQVLVAGGQDNNGVQLATAELYDPTKGMFSATGNMTTARARGTATLLRTGKVLITGGDPFVPCGFSRIPGTAELYDPSTGTFTSTATMTFPSRTLANATLLNNGFVLIAGGICSTGILHSTDVAELYNPKTGTFHTTGSMTMQRAMATATLLGNGNVLVAGGAMSGGGGVFALSSAELYNSKNGKFTVAGNMSSAHFGATATGLDR